MSNFSFSPSVFKRLELQTHKKLWLVWERVNPLNSHTMTAFNYLGKEPLENILEIEENADNQHFLLFPRCFLPFQTKTGHVVFCI